MAKDAVLTGLQRLLSMPTFVVHPGLLPLLATEGLATAKPGFLDRLIRAEATAARLPLVTFEKAAARGNLSELLRRALKGDDIGIVVDGKIVALRPVAVESMDYATREYGATAMELNHFEQRTHGEIE